MRRFLALALASILLVAQVAWAQDTPDKHPPGAHEHYSKGRNLAEQRQWKAAIAEYEKAIAIDPNYDYAFGSTGFAYYELGDFNKAAQNFEKAIAINPSDAFYWSELGLCYVKLGDAERGIPALRKSAELDPSTEAIATYLIGQLYESKGDKSNAAASYRRVLELKPNPKLSGAALEALERVK